MAKVEIYTWKLCPFCMAAKKLLSSKGVDFIEYQIDGDEKARQEMAARGTDGKRSVPQIYINDRHIPGGNAKLQELEKSGELDKLLNEGNNNGNDGPNGVHPA